MAAGAMSLASPALVQAKLEAIDEDLALMQNDVEAAAMDWFKVKREREKARAEAFLTAKGTDTARRFMADLESAGIGMEAEGLWEGRKARQKVLETRANVGMALLKSQGRS